MYKYIVEASNQTELGNLERVTVTVTAATEDAAVERAQKIVSRSNYAIIGIEELPIAKINTTGNIKKG